MDIHRTLEHERQIPTPANSTNPVGGILQLIRLRSIGDSRIRIQPIRLVCISLVIQIADAERDTVGNNTIVRRIGRVNRCCRRFYPFPVTRFPMVAVPSRIGLAGKREQRPVGRHRDLRIRRLCLRLYLIAIGIDKRYQVIPGNANSLGIQRIKRGIA